MTDAKEEAEELVYSGSDYDDDDNEVLPKKKRGTKLNYVMIKTFGPYKLKIWMMDYLQWVQKLLQKI
jgi:hypothetical protein